MLYLFLEKYVTFLVQFRLNGKSNNLSSCCRFYKTFVFEIYSYYNVIFVGTVYFQYGRKNPKIVVDHYDFYYQKKRDNTTYWYCSSNGSKKCKARVITIGSMVRVIGGHNHLPKEIKKALMEPQEVVIVRYVGRMESHYGKKDDPDYDGKMEIR